ncbi:DUF2206 domain-containing protein [Halorientalis litorea]|uniref:DUF2206 domain-containing protein n=1 Tax=Halorientalis litorea TaxID=2931977 RepID=UPI001FF4CDD6|nr:DUF2206 domain-containing protein [Halorientalis litorea]
MVVAVVVLNLPLLRPLIVISYLLLVPGTLVLGLGGSTLNRVSDLLYAVALSLVVIMLVGATVNTVYLTTIIISTPPFTEEILLTVFLTVTGILTVGFRYSDAEPELPTWNDLARLYTPYPLFLLSLPAIAVFGGLLLRWYADNRLLLGLYLIIGLLTVVIGFQQSEPKFPNFTVWCVAIALLLQNHIALPALINPTEYYVANLVISHEFWNPDLMLNKNGMLQIVITQPVVSILGDVPLMWVYKLVFPLYFSLVVVALNKVNTRWLSVKGGMMATLLYVFSFPFFTKLGHIIRTGSAILFVGIFLVALLDDELPDRLCSVVLVAAVFGATVSHYGVAPIFLFILIIVFIFRIIDGFVGDGLFPNRRQPSTSLVVFSIVVLNLWYNLVASSRPLRAIWGIPIAVIVELQEFFTATSSAGHAISASLPSLTYQLIQYEYILITLLAGIGVSMVCLEILRRSRISKWLPGTANRLLNLLPSIETDALHMSLGVGGMLLFVSAFAPTSVFGISRIYMIGLFFVASFAVLTSVLISKVTFNSESGGIYVFSVILFVTLLLNTGFISATVTHGRSPQASLEQDRILNEGSDRQLYNFFGRYESEIEVQSTKWLIEHKRTNLIYTGGRGISSQYFYTGYDTSKPPGVTVSEIESRSFISPSYIYLNEFSTRTGKVLNFKTGFSTYTQKNTEPISFIRANEHQRIYDAGSVVILFNDVRGE